jgi:hypothetical protein
MFNVLVQTHPESQFSKISKNDTTIVVLLLPLGDKKSGTQYLIIRHPRMTYEQLHF